jgi:hypothetical protein
MFRQPTIGTVECRAVTAEGKTLWTVRRPNTLVYTGVDLLARILAWQDLRINAAYLEFMPAGGGDPPETTVDPAEGRSYYQDIDNGVGMGSDYLRVPIVVPPYIDSTDADRFAGNRVTFSAFSTGSQGVNGKPFGDNATIFGLALVYAPDMGPGAREHDIVFARSYGFSPKVKAGTHQIMLSWAHVLGNVLEPA